MLFALVLYFDPETESLFQELIDLVSENIESSHMLEYHIPPHITVGA